MLRYYLKETDHWQVFTMKRSTWLFSISSFQVFSAKLQDLDQQLGDAVLH